MRARPNEVTLFHANLDDLTDFDYNLIQGIIDYPDIFILRFEHVIIEIYTELHEEGSKHELTSFQIEYKSSARLRSIRDLTSDLVSSLVIVPDNAVSSSKPAIKAYRVVAQCKGCQQELFIPVEAGLSGIGLPRTCVAPRPELGLAAEKRQRDHYVIIPERCQYALNQTRVKVAAIAMLSVTNRRTTKGDAKNSNGAFPITVKQLEAIVRLSEALAKMK